MQRMCASIYISGYYEREKSSSFCLMIIFFSRSTLLAWGRRVFSYRVTYTTTCHGGSVAVSSSFSPKLVNFKGCQLSWREQRLFSFLLFGRIKLN